MDIFEVKIENIKNEIKQGREGIDALKKNEIQAEMEIQRLNALRERFQKIYSVKNYEAIGDTEKVGALANKVLLKDLLEIIADAANIRLDLSISAITGITQLTIWQALFLFFGNLESLGKKNVPEVTNQQERETGD